MKKHFHQWALVFFLLMPSLLHANLIKVDDPGDPAPVGSGTMTLRNAVAVAGPGDTIIMDIAGTVFLTSDLTINKHLRIMGAYPAHSAINVNNGEIRFDLPTADTILFAGFFITSSGAITGSAVRVLVGTHVQIRDCLFEDLNTSANGAAIFVSGHLMVRNTAFFDNVASGGGGAVYFSNITEGKFYNCTFYGNTATANGGAISTSGNILLMHCTFSDNAAANGEHVYTALPGASVMLTNNIFATSTPSGLEFGNSGGASWTSTGGNIYTFNPAAGTIIPHMSDNAGASFGILNLSGTFKDGYGLKYLKLMPGSLAIDFGVTAASPPQTDCRRAPRILYGNSSLKADAGAVEYTPYTVTSTSGSPGVTGSLPERLVLIGATVNPGPFYIDFGLTVSPIISLTSISSISRPDVFIDGYTHTLSVIAGPGATPNTVTPAVVGYTMAIPAGSTAIQVLPPANNARVHGLGFGNGDYGLYYGGGSNHELKGNEFYGQSIASVYTNNVSGIDIGGQYHHQRNIVTNSYVGLNITQSSSVKINGNFIGTNNTGMALGGAGNGRGIYAVTVTGLYIGGDHFRGRGNLIAGSLVDGIELNDVNNTAIYGNYFGLNYQGTGSIENGASGILVNTGTGTIKIGKPGPAFRNYICNNDISNVSLGAGIKVMFFNGDLDAHNNYIGVDRSNNFAPNGTGVVILNSSGVSMGDGTPQAKNIISYNTSHGIYIDGTGANLNYFNKNFIGIKNDNSPAANGGIGIHIVNGAANNTILNNVISSGTSVGSGIHLNGAGSDNDIAGNLIGTDSTGTLAIPNSYGIHIVNTAANTVIRSNLVSGNTLDGINISVTDNVTLYNNIVGLNLTTSTPMPNGGHGISIASSNNVIIGNTFGGNTVAANTLSGILLWGCNNLFIRRNFIGTNNSLMTGLGNGSHGIVFEASSSVGRVGNIAAPADSNTIMYNTGHGVYVMSGCDYISIQRNKIHQNGALGISLDNGGGLPLLNDANDADAVASYGNAGQNFPVLMAATHCGDSTKIAGNINVDATGLTYRVDFYSVPAGQVDPSGYGEGDYYIGGFNIIPASNTEPFIYTHFSVIPAGTVITATLTKMGTFDATSEFSDTILVKTAYTADASVVSNVSCIGAGDGVASVTHGGVPPFNYSWYNGSTLMPGYTTATAASLAAGNYHSIVKDISGCYIHSDTVTVTEPAALNYSLLPVAETCTGDNDGSVSLTINSGGTAPFTMQFYDASSTVINSYPAVAYSTTVTETGLAPGNYAVLVTDANGCKDSLTFNVAASASFVNGNISTSGDACLGSGTGFADVSTGSPAPTTWQWDFGDSNSSSAMNPTNIYAAAGTYTVQLIVSNGVCDDTVSTSVTVNPPPTVNAGPDLELCQSTVVYSTLSGTVTGASSFYWAATEIVSWAPDSLSLTTDAYYSGAAVSSGSMDFILTALSPGCAPVDDSVHVVFTPPHSANAGADMTICSSSPAVLTGTITGSASATWSGAGSFSPGPTTLTGVAYTPTAAEISAGTATVTLTTDPLGACATASDAVTITILASPVADAGADQSVCPGGTVTLNGSGSTGTITSYQWDEAGGPSVGSGVTVNVTPTVTTSYILTAGNGTCSDADTTVVTITTPPDASFSYSSAPFCANDPSEIPVSAVTGGYYDVVGGLGVTMNTSTGEIYPSLSIPGTYNIYHELTTPCLSQDTISITIYALPVVTVTENTGDTTMCPGDTLHFTGLPAGGTFGALTGFNTATGEYIGFLAGTGTHTVQYFYTDGVTGCTGSASQQVVVHPAPVVSFTGLGTGPFCPSDGPMTLTGTPAGGGFVQNGVIVSLTNIYNYDPTTPGVDSIAYVYQEPVTGCANFDFELVVVTTGPPTPILTTAGPYVFCGSAPQTLTVSNPATTVTWYSDAGLTSVLATGVSISSSLLVGGTGTVYVTNATPSGCESVPLAVNYASYTFDGVDMGGPYEVCAGSPIEIMMTVPGGVLYAWLPDTGLVDTTALHPVVSPTQTNTYTVQLTQAAFPSCIAYDSVRVDVQPCSLENVTNAFSPDGDGVNEMWIIAGIEQHPDNRVTIFNRWGDKLVQMKGYDNTTVVWDGRYNGSLVAAGTYYYVIEYMDDGQQAAGWVQLNY